MILLDLAMNKEYKLQFIVHIHRIVAITREFGDEIEKQASGEKHKDRLKESHLFRRDL
jgi:hypothetical protein